MKPDLQLAEDLLAKALHRGADQAEVFCRSYRNITVEVRDQAIESLSSSSTAGYGLRIIKNSRLGFSFSTDPDEADQVVAQAMDACLYVSEDSCQELPAPAQAGEVDIFDRQAAAVKEEEAITLALQIERAALDEDGRIRKVRRPLTSFSVSETALANSHGFRGTYQATACSAQVMAIAEEGTESRSGSDFQGSRFLGSISCDEVGRTAARAALRLLGARRLESSRTTVLLDPSVTVEFLGVFASMLSSDAVQKGRSLLAGRCGKQVISPGISIIDSGILPGRLGSKPFDDEGVPTSATALIREGVLQGYLFNTYTANRGGTSSTGNAARGSFGTVPSVGVTNLFIEPAAGAERIAEKDLFSRLHRGLHIVDAMGIHTINPVSGDFSIGVSGIWVDRGQAVYPVKEAIISGNLLELFGKVTALGNDPKTYGRLFAPSLIIADLDLSA